MLKDTVAERIGTPSNKFFFQSTLGNREIKEMSKAVSSLGLSTSGNRIDIVMGQSKFDGKYQLAVSTVVLNANPVKDKDVFTRTSLGDLLVEPK